MGEATDKGGQPAADAPEVDDFGLPIRKFKKPVVDNVANDGSDEAKYGTNGSGTSDAPAPAQLQLEEKSHSSKPEVSETRDQGTPVEKTGEQTNGVSQTPDNSADHISTPTAPEDPTTPKLPSVAENEPRTPTRELKQEISDGANEVSGDKSQGRLTAQDDEKAPPSKNDQEPAISDAKVKKSGHGQQPSVSSLASVTHEGGLSEFSHQQLSTQPEEAKADDDGEWQTMPAYARYDMYDDDDKLIAREHDADEEEKVAYGGLGGAGKGYTRVHMDDDAMSNNSMDDNTQYLFKEGAKGTAVGDEDEEGRDAVSQMQATKDLLTEGQRIAYVGVVRLEIAGLVDETENIESTKKIKKMIAMSAESTKMWGQKMMIRLYAHMDISSAEQVMIEQLAEHGVKPADLVPALHANARVKNPMADSQSEGTDRNEGDESKTDTTPDEISKPDSKTTGSDEETALPRASSPTKGGDETPQSKPGSFEDEEEPEEPPPPYEAHQDDEVPELQDPSEMPSTEKIDIDLRWTVLCDLFLILIADSIYDSRSRVLIERVGKSLDISWTDICRFEKRVTDALEMQQASEKENWNEDEHMENRRKRAQKKRYMMLGLATVGGGLVIGLSAGLLAPVIGAGLAAGFTTIGVAGTGSFLGGVGGAAVITSGAAASGSFIGAKAANRRMGSVKTFEYRPLHNNKRVNLIVTISGWLTGKVDDVRLPFSTVDSTMGDLYSVLWEPELLQSTGDTVRILATEALTQSIQQVLASTILTALMGALQLPIVLTKLSYLIDNPWAVSLDRATAAGKILADSLIERSLGTRPITLVGYSLGARVIFSCLQELAKRGAYGCVQNVYLFGSPIVYKKEEYLQAKTVVPGRFVNGYNRTDWILGYLFRLTNGGIRRVAGLAPIDDCPWIENMDVTEFVVGHMAYREAMPRLLMECGWLVDSEEFAEIEDPDPDNHDQRQRELINEIEEARKALEKEGEEATGKKSRFTLFGRKKKMEKKDWELYEDKKDPSSGKDSGDGDAAYRGALFDVDAIRAELAKEAGSRRYSEEEIQIKEIESTLPPMKLDLSAITSSSTASTPTALHRPQGSLRETRSVDHVPIRNPVEDEEQIKMTFDTSFDEPPRQQQQSSTQSSRPEMKSSQTLPSVPMSNPWGDPDDDDFGKEKEISMTFA